MSKTLISTDEVKAIASEMANLNNQLTDQLEDSQTVFDTLGQSWTGEAYEASRSAYKEFANKYFESYREIIDSYVKFLEKNVADGYFEVETQNINLSDNFK